MDSKKAMKQALEALLINCGGNTEGKGKEAITALREALAEQPAPMSQPNRVIAYSATTKLRELGYEWVDGEWKQPAQQEPVAYAVYHRMGGSKSLHWPEQHSPDGDANEYQLLPLYTSQPQRTWVGLTDVEIASACKKHGGAEWWWRDIEEFAKAIEAKLKENNK